MAATKPGLLVLINNEKFAQLSRREGTDIDEKHLVQFFGSCGFNVKDEIHHDLKCEDMLKVVQRVRTGMKSYQCLVLAILTHGDSGCLYGKNSKYNDRERKWLPHVPVNTILTFLSSANCPALMNKPRILILQACQGNNKGVGEAVIETLNIDSKPSTPLASVQAGSSDGNDGGAISDGATNGTPNAIGATGNAFATGDVNDSTLEAADEISDTASTDGVAGGADTADRSSAQSTADNLIINFNKLAEPGLLIAYATSDGDFAYRRDGIGSWFVYALMMVLDKYGYGKGFLSNLTRVNRLIAYLFSTDGGNTKQMPVFVSMLTEDIHFIPNNTIRALAYPKHIAKINHYPLIGGEYDSNQTARNYCLLINNTQFKSLGLESRGGSNRDAQLLTDLFQDELNFEVIRKANLTKNQMIDECDALAQQDHTDRSCVVCIVLTYSVDRSIYGTDDPLSIDDVMKPFKANVYPENHLVGKPKFFIFQACDATQPSDTKKISSINVKYRIPVVADFLTSFSSLKGNLNWGQDNTRGSLFIETLVSVFKEHHQHEDVLTMLTRVNKQLADSVAGNTKPASVACVVSQLTKDLYLNPGNAVTSPQPPNLAQ